MKLADVKSGKRKSAVAKRDGWQQGRRARPGLVHERGCRSLPAGILESLLQLGPLRPESRSRLAVSEGLELGRFSCCGPLQPLEPVFVCEALQPPNRDRTLSRLCIDSEQPLLPRHVRAQVENH